MEYLFLKRKKTTTDSVRQKTLLYKAAERRWKEVSVGEGEVRKADSDIYKGILYQLEIRLVFLDASLSLRKLSEMLDTNQTYLSIVVNRYFGCYLKELVNTYRVQYAKELLVSGRCTLKDLPESCGFASKSAFYAAFCKVEGMPPLSFRRREGKERTAWKTDEVTS